jgi:DNA mismatch repair ATPase MutS
LYRSVGELDAVIAVMSFRKSLPYYCQPEFIADSRVEMDGIYHPLIEKPVENSFVMTRGCLVSGSNASGKSTFIKAVAISAILAQTVNTCLARRLEMRPALVMTSMAVRDDVTAGESYFVTEIKSLHRILDKLSEVFCICFIDEILKGTNTAERIAASAATLNYLNGHDCLCAAATHDVELTRMLADKYDNYHFAETVTDEGIVFNYRIQSGPTRTRNAIRLLEFMGFDERIITDAQQMAENFDKTGKWPDSV